MEDLHHFRLRQPLQEIDVPQEITAAAPGYAGASQSAAEMPDRRWGGGCRVIQKVQLTLIFGDWDKETDLM